MLKKFKLSLYYFIQERLLEDKAFISVLYYRLSEEKSRLDKIKEDIRIAKHDAFRRKLAEEHLAEIKKRQDLCSHSKGTKGVRGPCTGRDFAIWDHTFPTGIRTVRCLICSKEWKGDELKSEEVLHMLNSTTNTATSSEIAHSGNIKDRSEPLHILPQFGDEKDEEERQNNPLWPWASRVYVKWWDKMYKKLTRKKRGQ